MKAIDFLKSRQIYILVKFLEKDEKDILSFELLVRDFIRDELAFIIKKADEMAATDDEIHKNCETTLLWLTQLSKLCCRGSFFPMSKNAKEVISDWKSIYYPDNPDISKACRENEQFRDRVIAIVLKELRPGGELFRVRF